MNKPRLSVRLAVALVTFVLGVACTLLVNYFWPGAHTSSSQAVRVELRVASPAPPPAASHGPCGMGHEPVVQPAFAWTPDEPPPPPPPAPPVAPPPPAPRPR
ncbi:MAG TPA: hypothetical protein VF546_18465 [Pyrinomonadaceae bacterium]|jgi:hypothetical protein